MECLLVTEFGSETLSIVNDLSVNELGHAELFLKTSCSVTRGGIPINVSHRQEKLALGNYRRHGITSYLLSFGTPEFSPGLTSTVR
jgi:hypothetical protein